MKNFDVIIVGGGSGGIGAALSASRAGCSVLLVEMSSGLGGNATVSGVSVWEMGVGATGTPFDIYKRLKRLPDAVGIYRFNKHRAWQLQTGETPLHPGAELTIDPGLRYIDSLRRFGARSLKSDEQFVRKYWHGVPFEPAFYQQAVEDMLRETGHCTVWKSVYFKSAEWKNGLIHSLLLSNDEEVRADIYIDATDSGVLCRSCGCHGFLGQESRDIFDEPDAPEHPSEVLNGVSLIYRISGDPHATDLSVGRAVPGDCWWASQFPLSSIVQYPNGDLNVNMLPTMEGLEFRNYSSYQEAYKECHKRVLAHWAYLKRIYPPYSNLKLIWIAPRAGVRENHRIEGNYVLTEMDLLSGLSGQKHPDIITIADHPMDSHGTTTGRSGCIELSEPYGVPFRCLIPKGMLNLMVASRAASFSSLAASSCRLSRTMMHLGQAAGSAAAIAVAERCLTPEIDICRLKDSLVSQHVQLEWPMTDKLKKYVESE